MLMVPPSLGAAPARRGAPAASMPTAAPASTSRRVNDAPPAGTTLSASETNKAIRLLLAAPLLEPCGKCRAGMRACQQYLPESRKLNGAFGGEWRLSPPLAIPAASAKGHED